MYGETWYDVIMLEHGSREIIFSHKSEKVAVTVADTFHQDGKIVYTVRNTVQLNGVVKKHLLDFYNNYVPYEVKDDE